MDGFVEWARNLLWDEIVVRYVVPGVVLVIGTLFFGRRYKSRIRSLEVARLQLEEQVARLQKQPQDETDKVAVLHTPDQKGTWQETPFTLKQGLTYRLQFEDQGRENVIQLNKAYRLIFTDAKASHFWSDQVDGDVRRYRSGPYAAGYGLRDVFVMIEPADST